MRKTRRIVAVLISLFLVFTMLPAELVYATESAAVGEMIPVNDDGVVENAGLGSESEPEVEAISEVEEVELPELLEVNYLLLEKESVTAPGSQTVVASIGDGTAEFSGTVLNYKNQGTGAIQQVSAKTIVGDGMVFEIIHDNASAVGIYELESIGYTMNGATQTISLADAGINVIYGVNKDVDVEADAYLTEEDPEDVVANVVTFDEKGNQVSETSISDALEGGASLPGAIRAMRAAPRSGNLVVVLDPGHDERHSGASYFGFREEERVLKIALAARDELSRYQGVTIHMTRTTGACPNGGGSSSDCLSRRVAIARSVGANVFVSFHLNASTSSSARGAGIYVPNNNYRPDIGAEASGLGREILNKLLELGLSSWGGGLHVRNSENNSTYPDGSLRDYLAVIAQSKEAGITPVLIEHAFMSNSGDVNFINTDDKLKKLGIAGATGIATFYNLSMTGDLREEDYAAVYNFDYYIKKYPDVASAFGESRLDVLQHFVNAGMYEGRQGNSNFNVMSYGFRYSDLRAAFGKNLKAYYLHFMNTGQREGRQGIGTTTIQNPVTRLNGVDYSAVYDYTAYSTKYSDLQRAFSIDDTAMLAHFINAGMREGRQGKSTFSVSSYRLKYSDLRAAFGNNLPAYYMHFINAGQREGRQGTGTTTLQNPITRLNGVDYSAVYNFAQYSARYGDLRNTFGQDDVAMLAHFVNAGMREGRLGNNTFDVNSYRLKYRDLRLAFGNDLQRYYLHYVNAGKGEGRVATGTTTVQNPITTLNGIDYGSVYNFAEYSARNRDLQNAFKQDDVAMLTHFVNAGMREGRIASANFNVHYYRNNYRDLQNAFGNDWMSYFNHYRTQGGPVEHRVANRPL